MTAPSLISIASDQKPKPRRKWLGLKCLGLLLLLLALLVVFHGPLLNGAARAWMVNAPLAKAQAIVVLGGDPNARALEAVRLYRAAWAPLILVMSPKLQNTDNLGITIPQAELTRRILLTNAVPADAIQLCGTNLNSTFEEAVAVKNWLKDSGASSLIIPTGVFHSRRVRWVFHKTLPKSTELTVTSIHPEDCRKWWDHENTLIDFHNEIIKFAYYLVSY